MTNMGMQQKKKSIKVAKFKLNKLFKLIDIGDWHEPLIKRNNAEKAHTQSTITSDYLNPYDQITCLVLYLYSMEFGTPPLYAEANRVAREMDMSQL